MLRAGPNRRSVQRAAEHGAEDAWVEHACQQWHRADRCQHDARQPVDECQAGDDERNPREDLARASRRWCRSAGRTSRRRTIGVLFRSCVDPLLSYLRNDVSMPILTVDANKGAHSPRYNP